MRLNFFYGWIIVFASILCLFAFGVFETYGVFFKPLIEEFGWSRTLTSSVFSLYTITHTLSGIIMGRLSDKYGSRKVIMFGSLLTGFGIFLSSQINSILHLYIFWGLASFGSGVLWVPPMATVIRWFKEKRGLAVGIATSGYGIGILVIAPLAAIITSTYGWRMCFMILGIVLLVILLAAAFMMKSNPKSTELKVHVKGKDTGLSLKQIIFTKPFLMLYVIYFFTSICFTSLLVHVVPFALDIGMSNVIAALALGLIGGSSTIGSIVLGAISDKVGRHVTLTVCLIAQAGIMLWLIWANNVWMLYSFAVIFGFSIAGVWVVMAPLVEEFFGLDKVGVNLGILATTYGVGGILGPIMFGYLFDVLGSYQLGLVFCLLITIVAALISYLLKISRRETFSTNLQSTIVK